jgi:predicted MPP superfamily phosphohydrolase
MKIHLLSDLHVEFYDDPKILCEKINKLYPNVAEDDILIIAGDLGVAGTSKKLNDEYKFMLKYFGKKWNSVFYVAGNHEYYDRKKTESIQDISDAIEAYCVECGIIFLDNDIFETSGYIFVGTTLWTNVNEEAYENMNDKLQAILSRDEVVSIHKANVKWLNTTLNKLQKLKDSDLRSKSPTLQEKPVIVITHHLPLKEVVHKKFLGEEYSITHSGYFSDLTDLVTKHNNIICHWYHGHMHEAYKKKVYDIHFCANPMGYPDEEMESPVKVRRLSLKE